MYSNVQNRGGFRIPKHLIIITLLAMLTTVANKTCDEVTVSYFFYWGLSNIKMDNIIINNMQRVHQLFPLHFAKRRLHKIDIEIEFSKTAAPE